jgi:hypothetical protein
VSFAVTGAARLELRVDGLPTDAEPSNGSLTVSVLCDPLPHQFVLLAYDEDGTRTSQEHELQTIVGR